ncbi:ArsR/SmtB family transcription factor [Endozoicomonas sp. SCSIO W0465]|uniref:ArsR/SmtB family transcription factor n=1 Tax=Endozoicomonas sp. SCSIO W0465 TaxID=2918516 RepID=UPI0035327AEC
MAKKKLAPVGVDIKTMRKKMHNVMPLLKAISNESRLLILCHLGQGELSVTELWERFDLSQSALSQHLAKLRKDGLVHTRRDSQTIYYSLASPEAARLIEFLHSEYCK